MKRLMILLILLCATSAFAQFPTNSNTKWLNQDRLKTDFGDFTWQWDAWSDQGCTFNITNDSGVIDIENYFAQFRVTGRSGKYANTNFIDLTASEITMSDTYKISFTISRTNIPPVNTYNAQLILLSSVSTQAVASAGKGTIKVNHSLFKVDGSDYPFPTNSSGATADVDMNGFGILSLGAPSAASSATRLQDIYDATNGLDGIAQTYTDSATNELDGDLRAVLIASTNELDGITQTYTDSATNDLDGITQAYTIAATNELDGDLRAVIISSTNGLDAITQAYTIAATNELDGDLRAVIIASTNDLDAITQAYTDSATNGLDAITQAYTIAATNELDTDLRAVIISSTNGVDGIAAAYTDAATNDLDGITQAYTIAATNELDTDLRAVIVSSTNTLDTDLRVVIIAATNDLTTLAHTASAADLVADTTMSAVNLNSATNFDHGNSAAASLLDTSDHPWAVETNDTGALNFTGATITIATGSVSNNPVTKQQLDNAGSAFETFYFWGSTKSDLADGATFTNFYFMSDQEVSTNNETTLTYTSVTANQYTASFCTTSGVPGITEIQSGNYSVVGYLAKSSAKSCIVKVEAYLLDSVGATKFEFENSTQHELSQAKTRYDFDIVLASNITQVASDRWAIKFKIVSVGAPSPNLMIYTEGSSQSYLTGQVSGSVQEFDPLSLHINGDNYMMTNANFGGFKGTNVADGTAYSHAATYGQLTNTISAYLPLAGGTLVGDVVAGVTPWSIKGGSDSNAMVFADGASFKSFVGVYGTNYETVLKGDVRIQADDEFGIGTGGNNLRLLIDSDGMANFQDNIVTNIDTLWLDTIVLRSATGTNITIRAGGTFINGSNVVEFLQTGSTTTNILYLDF